MVAHPGRTLFLLYLSLATSACLQCAPACQPLPEIVSSNSSSSAFLDPLSCYVIDSSSHTPSLSLLPPLGSPSATITWTSAAAAAAAAPVPQQLPVLDLCNQVQSIWLMPGVCALTASCVYACIHCR